MKSIAGFEKTTVAGGLLVILPVYLAVLLLARSCKPMPVSLQHGKRTVPGALTD